MQGELSRICCGPLVCGRAEQRSSGNDRTRPRCGLTSLTPANRASPYEARLACRVTQRTRSVFLKPSGTSIDASTDPAIVPLASNGLGIDPAGAAVIYIPGGTFGATFCEGESTHVVPGAGVIIGADDFGVAETGKPIIAVSVRARLLANG